MHASVPQAPVDRALAWLHDEAGQRSRDALEAGLREAGYGDTVVAEAMARLDREESRPHAGGRVLRAGHDLRAVAIGVMLGVLAITWAVILLAPAPSYGSGLGSGLRTLAAVALGLALVPAAVVAVRSRSLAAATPVTLVAFLATAFLAVPLAWLLLVAGSCIVSIVPPG